METPSSEVLANRALNASRKLHMPTYIATRYLVETVAGNNSSNWIYQVAPRKYLMRSSPKFYKFQKFKKNGVNGKLIYREFVVPGPTSLLAEAILLAYFSQDDQFKKTKHVYSYIWPSSQNCPYNFEYYISGYKKKNENIARYLEDNPGKIVIVSDIEEFYSSIEQELIRKRFVRKLEESSMPVEVKSLARHFLEDVFSFFPEGKGVITGPEFSHVIGDIALEEFDSKLVSEYGDAYFRYVDDIVLIVDPEDKKKSIDLLEELALKEGLRINSEKSDVVASDVWLKYGPHNDHTVKEGSFESLVFKIKVYLQFNQDSEASLSKALKDSGFSIPISRLSRASKEKDFVEKLIGFVSNRWKVVRKAALANEDEVLAEAMQVKKGLYRQILQQTESNTPEGSTLRKWHLQKLRYLTNRAVYLFPHSELGFLREKLQSYSEFVDSVALLDVLIDDNYNALLNMPGAALNACAGILHQNGRRLDEFAIKNVISKAQVESASVFALWDVIDLTFDESECLDGDIFKYLKVSSSQALTMREINSFTYLDEILLLGIHKTKSDRLETLETRFSDSERYVLDALDIGWNSEH